MEPGFLLKWKAAVSEAARMTLTTVSSLCLANTACIYFTGTP